MLAGGDVPQGNWSKNKTDEFSIPIYSNGTSDNALYGYTNISKIEEDAVSISARGTIGYAAIRKAPFYPIVRLIVAIPDTRKILLRYLFEVISQLDFKNSGKTIPQLTVPMIKDKKIPVPPIEVQKQIIAECEKIDDEYNSTRMSIEEYRKRIENIFDGLEVSAENKGTKGNIKLSSIASFNPSKSLIQGISDDIMVSFVEMASVSNDGYIEKMTQRPFGAVKKGSYTYFAENDIIIAKITPCMENGKCAVANGLTNGIAFGSSEFHVVRCDENYLPNYVFGFLNRSKVRVEAKKNMTGASGHRRVPVSYYQNIDIPIMPLTKQKEIIDKVEKWQSEIYALQSRLSELSVMKNKVLEKYL